MTSPADVAFAFLQRHFPGHPDREELRFALAALVAERDRQTAEAVREACAAVAESHSGDGRYEKALTIAAALRELPLD